MVNGIELYDRRGKKIGKLSHSECISVRDMLKKLQELRAQNKNPEIAIVFRGTKTEPKRYFVKERDNDYIPALSDVSGINVDINYAVNSFIDRYSDVNGFCLSVFHNHPNETTTGISDICNLIDFPINHMFIDSGNFIFVTWKTDEAITITEDEKEKYKEILEGEFRRICISHRDDFYALYNTENASYEEYYSVAYRIKDELWEVLVNEYNFPIMSVRIPKLGIESYKEH